MRISDSSADALLARAVDLHRSGDVTKAIRHYEAVVEQVPQHAGALNLLGLAYFQSGDAAKAVAPIERALALQPDLPGANFNLGFVLYSLHRYQEAIPYFEKAIVSNPRDFEAHANLAGALLRLNRNAAAADQFKMALALRPQHAGTHLNLANLLLAEKDYDRAALHFHHALAGDPNRVEAYVGITEALRELALNDEAIKFCERGLALDPDNTRLQYVFAGALHDTKRFRDAHEWYAKLLQRMPDAPEAHYNYAATAYALNQYQEAMDHYRQALALNLRADLATTAELQIGWSLQLLGHPDEADKIFDKIIAKCNDSPEGLKAKQYKGMMYLRHGRLADGWPLYEYRMGASPPDVRQGKALRWEGQALDGILWVWGEQGLGDQILHAGMIEDVRRRVGAVILEVEPRLVDLYARSFPSVRVVALGTDLSSEPIEAQISIAGLGRYFRPNFDAFPKRSYLVADPDRTAALRAQLSGAGEKIVGLSWRSVSPQTGLDKSAKLIDFLPVLRLRGARFIDLQYGDTAEERRQVACATGISVARIESVDNTKDIDGLASLMSVCDAIVSVSNTNAHLAGALGKPTWVMAPFGVGQMWYWFGGHKDSPWYPRVKVRHQSGGQSWENLISQAAPEIANFLGLPNDRLR